MTLAHNCKLVHRTLIVHLILLFTLFLLQTGLINFDKRRKLFELLAQLTLYQKSAANYQFPCHSGLTAWLHTTPTLTAAERCVWCGVCGVCVGGVCVGGGLFACIHWFP